MRRYARFAAGRRSTSWVRDRGAPERHMRDAPAVLAAGVMGRAFWAVQVSRGCARSMLLCVVKVLRGRWQTSDGPLGVEGGLLLGQAFPVMVWSDGPTDRSKDNRLVSGSYRARPAAPDLSVEGVGR